MKYDINLVMQKYIDDGQIPNGILLVNQDNSRVFEGYWGYSDVEKHKPIQNDSIFRMMSMTKVATAIMIMQLYERGLLNIDDPLEKYIPAFGGQRVVKEGALKYTLNPIKLLFYVLTFNEKRIKTEPLGRAVTLRDLLSHSSGLQQGMAGLLMLRKDRKHPADSLEKQVFRYAEEPLDFQPGAHTNYSPIAGFNVLGYVVEQVSGKRIEEFMQENICKPLGLKDTTFFLNDEQKNRLVKVYDGKTGKLKDVSGTGKDLYGVLGMKEMAFEAATGGLYSTAGEYEKIAIMLLNDGVCDSVRILKKETVDMIHSEGAVTHLVNEPGLVWGLGVKIRENPSEADSFCTRGTYGWSGAFGTHIFISPEDNLEAVFMTNRSDVDGAASPISRKVEEMVFANWRK